MKLVYSWFFYLLFFKSVASSCPKLPVIDSNTNKASFENINSELPSSRISISYDAKGLQAFFNLANSFINTVQPKSLSGEFQGVKFKDLSRDENTRKIIKYETPIIVAAAFGVLFMILMSITGLCFCCCRCCNKCGGQMFHSEKNSKKHGKCIIMSLLLLIMAILLLCGVLFMFVTNNRLHETVKKSSTTYVDAVHDAVGFANNTIGQVKQIYENQIPCIILLEKEDLGDINVKKLIGDPLYKSVKQNVSNIIEVALNASQNVTRIYEILQRIAVLNISLNDDANSLKEKMKQISEDLKSIVKECENSSSTDKSVCSKLKSVEVTTQVNFTIFPDTSNELKTFKDVLEKDISAKISNGRKMIEDIPNTVLNKSNATRTDVIQIINNAENQLQQTLRKLTEDIQNTITTTEANLLRFKKNLFEPSSEELKYENYRWYIYIGISSVVAFIFVLMALGLLFGSYGYDKKVSPTHRSSASTCGGNFLMASVGFMFIFFAILMIFCIVWFAIGTHLYIVCRDVRDGKLIDNFLSEQLLFNGKKISVEHVLSQCRANSPLYVALNGENYYNISKELNVKEKADDITSKIESTSFDLKDQVLLTDDLKKILNDLVNSKIDSIDFASYFTMINEAITDSNLTNTASNLTTYAGLLNSSNYDIAEKLRNISSRLTKLENTVVANITRNLVDLENNVNILQNMAQSFKLVASDLLMKFTQSDNFIKNEAGKIFENLINDYANRLIGWLDQGFNHLKLQFTTNMLKCKPVANLYDGIFNNYMCSDLVQNANGFWLALGWCLLFFVPCIVLCVRLAKFFRKMKYGDSFDKVVQPPYNESYPLEVRSSVHDRSSLIDNSLTPKDAPPPYNQNYSNYQFNSKQNAGYHY